MNRDATGRNAKGRLALSAWLRCSAVAVAGVRRRPRREI